MAPTHLLDEKEAGRRLGLSVATMRRRRLLRLPPAWVKLGGRVLYRPLDLDTFIEANLVQPDHPSNRRDTDENMKVRRG